LPPSPWSVGTTLGGRRTPASVLGVNNSSRTYSIKLCSTTARLTRAPFEHAERPLLMFDAHPYDDREMMT
jgi:hypothetical protein